MTAPSKAWNHVLCFLTIPPPPLPHPRPTLPTHSSHACSGYSWQLGFTGKDLKYLALDLVGQGAPPEDLLKPQDLIDLPDLPAPDDYVHPYNSRSLLWQWIFTIRRCIWLVWNLGPVMRSAVWLALDPTNELYLEHWCDQLVIYINRAGCSFQKFGQWLSMRPDMFPPAMIKACGRLREEVPCHPYADTVHEIESTLGMKMDEIFLEFDPVPVASGSVGQVCSLDLGLVLDA